MNKTKNILIGFGLAGLGFVNYFKKNLIIFEKNKSGGGHARSHKIGKFYFDEGAHISHTKSNFFKKKFYIKKDLIKIINPNIVSYYQKKPIGYPINISLKKLSFSLKLKIFFDYIFLIFKSDKIDNFKDWCNYNFGKTLYSNFYRTYTLKYWRTEPRLLDHKNWTKKRIVSRAILKSIYSMFFEKEKYELVYNIFYYPKNGGFFNLFKKKFNEYKVNYNSNISEINLKNKTISIKKKKIKFDNLYSTVPLPEYLKLIKNIPPKIKTELKKLKFTSTICINFSIKKRKIIDHHLCYFYDTDVDASRMTLLSNILKEKKNIYYGQLEIFRRNDEKINIKEIEKNSKEFLLKFFNLNDKNDFYIFQSDIIKYSYPIPLNDNNLDKIHTWLKKNNIIPFGLYGVWRYMWSDESYINGKQSAEFYSR